MVARPDAFWRGKKVFVTGHTGFKGSWLSLWLQRLGADVTGYALATETIPSLFQLTNLGARMTSHIADVRDAPTLRTAMEEAHAEIVFHLAAQSLVRASYREPVDTFATNVMGTVHVLEATRSLPDVRVVVIVTSDKCYAQSSAHGHPFVESDRLGGHDPYSSSKACAELVTSAYAESFFGPRRAETGAGPAVASARAGNVIGGGDWAEDRLVPDLVRAWVNSTTTNIRAPEATRPWQHVLEPLSGYLRLASHLYTDGPAFAGAWNFGPDHTDVQTVRSVADRMVSGLGEGARWHHDRTGDHPHEAETLALDSTKARTALAWRPRWTVDDATARTAAWYRQWRSNAGAEAVRAACEADLDAYERIAHD